MSESERISSGDPLQKMGSIGFILGAVLVAVGSLLLPPAAVPSADWQQTLSQLSADVQRIQACALLLAFGYWGVMIGTAAVYRSIGGPAAAWARIGFYFSLMGTTLWTLGMSLDISYPAAIANWAASPGSTRDAAMTLVLAIPAFGRGLFPLEVIVIWLSYAFFGISMIQSSEYPRWLGPAGLILGILGATLGMTQAFTGREASIGLYIGLVGVTVVWWLGLGVSLFRKARLETA